MDTLSFFPNPVVGDGKLVFFVEERPCDTECVDVLVKTKKSTFDRLPTSTHLRCRVNRNYFGEMLNNEYLKIHWKDLVSKVSKKKDKYVQLKHNHLQLRQTCIQKVMKCCYSLGLCEKTQYLFVSLFDRLFLALGGGQQEMAQIAFIAFKLTQMYINGSRKYLEAVADALEVDIKAHNNVDTDVFALLALGYTFSETTPEMLLHHIFLSVQTPYIVVVTAFFFCEAQLLTETPELFNSQLIALSALHIALECLRLEQNVKGYSEFEKNLRKSDLECCKKVLAKSVRILLIINMSCVVEKYKTKENYQITYHLRHSPVLQKYSAMP